MAIRALLRMGDPRLLEVSAPVREFGSKQLLELIADMLDTMRAASGAGLAAPQIGVALRAVIFGGGPTPRYPDAEVVPFTVLINPRLKALPDFDSCEAHGGVLPLSSMKQNKHLRVREGRF